ncbi:class II aldolase/adducin family protein [Pseudomonas yamanorum]|uniref:class II aldolase/adducin family protein n=1 Tax=Pseudomonas yamanorum TaxID=515393 RepID=UPI001C44274E|nr:class II aldolase/adducin family protein [Pseudomonas yamanorum]MBV6659754.1 class II aldolase/adducin family protein [Pseudomonas yamanorum]
MSHVQQRIVDLSRQLARRGFFAATGGNLALRVDEFHMAVTPSAVDYFAMRVEDVCVLRLKDLVQVSGECAPSVESSLHARILRNRPDVHCSIHTHQPIASACTLMGQPLEVDHPPLRKSLGRSIPLVGYAPSGTRWLASKLERAVRMNCNAYLMRNHGVLCCGPDIKTTLSRLEELEALCREKLLAMINKNTRSQPGGRASVTRLLNALASKSVPIGSPKNPSEMLP